MSYSRSRRRTSWARGVFGSRRTMLKSPSLRYRKPELSAIGIDLEPARTLLIALLEFIATPSERLTLFPPRTEHCSSSSRRLCTGLYPLDRRFLDHHGVEVHSETSRAVVCTGRTPFGSSFLSERILWPSIFASQLKNAALVRAGEASRTCGDAYPRCH